MKIQYAAETARIRTGFFKNIFKLWQWEYLSDMTNGQLFTALIRDSERWMHWMREIKFFELFAVRKDSNLVLLNGWIYDLYVLLKD
jgi:hypothetical protein